MVIPPSSQQTRFLRFDDSERRPNVARSHAYDSPDAPSTLVGCKLDDHVTARVSHTNVGRPMLARREEVPILEKRQLVGQSAQVNITYPFGYRQRRTQG